MNMFRVTAVGLCLSGMMTLAAAPADAGPLPTSIAAVKAVAPTDVVRARWVGGWRGGARGWRGGLGWRGGVAWRGGWGWRRGLGWRGGLAWRRGWGWRGGVAWRGGWGWRRGWGYPGAFVGGLAAGAAIAGSPYYGYGYSPTYAYYGGGYGGYGGYSSPYCGTGYSYYGGGPYYAGWRGGYLGYRRWGW